MGRLWSAPCPLLDLTHSAQVLNLNTLYRLHLSDPEISPEVLLKKSLATSHSLAVEPRFTCTVSWIVSSSTHRQPVVIAHDGGRDVVVEEVSSSKSEKKKQKRKRAAAEEEEVAREPKVRFEQAVEAKEEAEAAAAAVENVPKKKNKKNKKKGGAPVR
jgi:hypothetical protein